MNGGLRSGFILAAAVLAVALLGPEVPGRLSGQGSELLTNGGFEDPIGPPWYGSANLRTEQVSEPRYEGNYAARLTVTNGRVGELVRVSSPAPGAGTYELSAWVGGGENVTGIEVIAEWYQSPDATGFFVQNYQLVYTGTAGLLSGQATVESPVQSVRAKVRIGPVVGALTATAFLDAVSLRFSGPPAPSPSPQPTATSSPGQPPPTPTPVPFGPGSLVFNEILYDAGIAGCGTDCK